MSDFVPGTTLAEIDYLNQLKSAIGLDAASNDEENSDSARKAVPATAASLVKKQPRRLSMQDVTNKYKPDDLSTREEERHITMMLHPGEFVILRGTVWKRAVRCLVLVFLLMIYLYCRAGLLRSAGYTSPTNRDSCISLPKGTTKGRCRGACLNPFVQLR